MISSENKIHLTRYRGPDQSIADGTVTKVN